jgi:2-amino-4-hydroxy-6-hydroxymethyldihydropteridine diphosphokinase
VNAVYLSLGSNLGERERMIETALGEIDLLDGTQLVRTSSLYDTEPLSEIEQPRFLNAVVEVETSLEPARLLWNLKLIERRLGRTPARRWGPRQIDIDILLYEDRTIDEPELVIPHPELRHRAFVLVPLAELAPDLRLPGSGESIIELREALGADQSIRRLGRLSF